MPEISVRLDGRYVTRTDAQGRFEFPLVAEGEHTIELIPDNIPLPWTARETRPQVTMVRVRATTVVDFGLVREP